MCAGQPCAMVAAPSYHAGQRRRTASSNLRCPATCAAGTLTAVAAVKLLRRVEEHGKVGPILHQVGVADVVLGHACMGGSVACSGGEGLMRGGPKMLVVRACIASVTATAGTQWRSRFQLKPKRAFPQDEGAQLSS